MIFKELAKSALKKVGLEVHRYVPKTEEPVVTLRPEGKSRGNVLLSYILKPFLRKPGEPLSTSHTNHWESLMIAQTFLDLGYCVDAIDFQNRTFVPEKHYAFFIDVRYNLERLAPLLNPDCIKIMHIDLCHMLFNNAAESRCLLDLQQRKGVTLQPRRFEFPNLAIEFADCATMLGNDFTEGTFAYAKKPIYRIPISQPVLYDWPEDKDFDACRKNFLWFGSGGLVRKGLDRTLEVFRELEDHRLYVCGPVKGEKDFEQAYHDELYNTPNITTISKWLDIASEEFIEITRNCVGLIYPSSSEGQCGTVVTCMHASLVPVVSYESGVDVYDFGVLLKECGLDTIKKAIKSISSLPTEQLRQMSRKTWEFARANHTRERSAEVYKTVIEQMMNKVNLTR